MTVELRPLGVRCNLQCVYCYQEPQRQAGNIARTYDIAAMKRGIEAEGGPFTLFGGEPLLIPKNDLEELWSWGFMRWGSNGIQTNGALIDDDHIAMFAKYNVCVGISIDGPAELNGPRTAGTPSATDRATRSTLSVIDRLCRVHKAPSLIVTLHRANALASCLPRMAAWLTDLAAKGVRSARLHTLEIDDELIRPKLALSTDELLEAYMFFAELERSLSSLRFDVFDDLRRQLVGDDRQTTCVWNACDPLTTRAVRGVEGFGQRSNCGRTNKEGIDFLKADQEGFERYIALYHTPQESNGCSGCRFFLACKGQCPGTAVDGDWRNRTEHCELWKALFAKIESQLLQEGKTPISVDGKRRAQLEARCIDAWSKGRNAYMSESRD